MEHYLIIRFLELNSIIIDKRIKNKYMKYFYYEVKKNVSWLISLVIATQIAPYRKKNWLSIDNKVFLSRHKSSSSVFTAELKTIFHCLQTILQIPDSPHHQNYIIFSDSLLSLQSISDSFFTQEFVLFSIFSLQFLKLS